MWTELCATRYTKLYMSLAGPFPSSCSIVSSNVYISIYLYIHIYISIYIYLYIYIYHYIIQGGFPTSVPPHSSARWGITSTDPKVAPHPLGLAPVAPPWRRPTPPASWRHFNKRPMQMALATISCPLVYCIYIYCICHIWSLHMSSLWRINWLKWKQMPEL